MESARNADLPEEIKQEILLRLPVKSLCRFKCVCKQWSALIGSPSFVNQHFCHESNQERLLIRHDRPDEKKYAFASHIDELCSRYEGTDHLQFPTQVTNLIGPLNGVFWVIGDKGSTALLNPAMRQFKPLPLLPTYHPPRPFSYSSLSGFGLDPSTGDYKLVFIQIWCTEGMGRPLNTFVSVCNSSSNSWRSLEDVDLVGIVCGDMPMFNTYLNGIYYWPVGTKLAKNYGKAILAFDMSNEKFQTIQAPDESKPGILTLCGDSVAYLTYDFMNGVDDKWIEVWMMKNDRCWIKSQRVGPFQRLWLPLGIFKKDEMLLQTDISPLDLCNLSTRKLRSVELKRMATRLEKRAILYKESLVSIKGEGDKCMLWDTSSKFVKKILGCSPWNRCDSCSWCDCCS